MTMILSVVNINYAKDFSLSDKSFYDNYQSNWGKLNNFNSEFSTVSNAANANMFFTTSTATYTSGNIPTGDGSWPGGCTASTLLSSLWSSAILSPATDRIISCS